jgi:glycolate oxidase iron-sulfur subunit
VEIHLDKKFKDQDWAKEASDIVRKCVHCGFCNATCPTYQLLGDEAEGPRGRIYLITQLLEGKPADIQIRGHLDRCLLCRACETTCPSGVEYGRLLETGRHLMEEQSPVDLNKLKRKAISALVPNTQLMQTGINIASSLRSFLPKSLSQQLPHSGKNLSRPKTFHSRKVLILEGCAQSSLTPETNAATARLLDRFGIMLVSESSGCCGAVRLHTSERQKGLIDVRQRIDTWWPLIETGVEAILSTASGCGVTVKEYGYLLKDDPEYAEKALRVSSLCQDLSEIIASEIKSSAQQAHNQQQLKVVFQNPCSLQHGQKITGRVETILRHYGFTLLPVEDGHICCGSAGTYSILQPVLSKRLKNDKLKKLQHNAPDVIVTANVGCQIHLRNDADVPVIHWVELLDNTA